MEPPVSEPSETTAVFCATTAADPPLDPPGTRSERHRIAHRPERAVLVRRPHRELIAIGLADDHSARRFNPLDGRRVVRRNVMLQHSRPARRAQTFGQDDVLHRHRHAGQQPRIFSRGDLCDPRVPPLSAPAPMKTADKRWFSDSRARRIPALRARFRPR